MSFIELPITDLDEIVEEQCVPEGTYSLVIADCKEKTNESGDIKGLMILCEIQGMDNAAKVFHNMALPLSGDDSDKINNKLKFIKRFLQLFKIAIKGNQLNPQDFLGKTASCQLKQEEYNGTISNKIVLPNSK
jgi:hypothetical protein